MLKNMASEDVPSELSWNRVFDGDREDALTSPPSSVICAPVSVTFQDGGLARPRFAIFG